MDLRLDGLDLADRRCSSPASPSLLATMTALGIMLAREERASAC